MATSKRTSKTEASKAARILNNPCSTKREKSVAASALSRRSIASRTVKSAPKSGQFSEEVIKKAIKSVSLTRDSIKNR